MGTSFEAALNEYLGARQGPDAQVQLATVVKTNGTTLVVRTGSKTQLVPMATDEPTLPGRRVYTAALKDGGGKRIALGTSPT